MTVALLEVSLPCAAGASASSSPSCQVSLPFCEFLSSGKLNSHHSPLPGASGCQAIPQARPQASIGPQVSETPAPMGTDTTIPSVASEPGPQPKASSVGQHQSGNQRGSEEPVREPRPALSIQQKRGTPTAFSV